MGFSGFWLLDTCTLTLSVFDTSFKLPIQVKQNVKQSFDNYNLSFESMFKVSFLYFDHFMFLNITLVK